VTSVFAGQAHSWQLGEMDEARWWQRGIVYQVYPRSFQDSDGDGVGDLAGITARLDHLRELGVDAVWICPFYPSPMADFGYDVADHTAVDPLFGSLADFDALVARAHRLGLRVLVDFVANHTSQAHPWFVRARATRDEPTRNWYLWADPAPDGGPPNNWRSVFGGPAWTLDERTGQYYYHAYLPEQPDLNWRNPEVRQAQLDVLRFWLDRGVDGFRVDACRQLVKDDRLRDNPPNPAYHNGLPPYEALLPEFTADRPENLGVVAELREVLDGHRGDEDGLLIAELYLPFDRLVRYYGTNGDGVHLPANMNLISAPYSGRHIAALIDSYEAALPEGAWPNWCLGNHDRSRIATRVGPARARVVAMLLLTLRGTPILYYGDEIGMPDVPVPAHLVRDPYEKRVPGLGVGRDPARSPMRWSGEENAGFCPAGTRPWLPVPSNAAHPDVAAQRADATSVLSLYQRLIALRRAESALSVGDYERLAADTGLLVYRRRHHDRRCVVALNLADRPRTLPVPVTGHILLATGLDRTGERVDDPLTLRGDEGVVVAED
jgi:alpha-glucosidase